MLGTFLRRLFSQRKTNKQTTHTNAKHVYIDPNAKVPATTTLEDYVRLGGGSDFSDSSVGRHTYAASALLPNCSIGRFCSISRGCQLIVGSHPTSFVSTWPGFFQTMNSPEIITHFNDELRFSELLKCSDGRFANIGNDVWIGQDATIKGGVTIGDGAIIGANALVTKDVPPYAIVGGVPAKIIRYRFNEDEIQFLLSLKWWDWDDEKLKKYAKYFDSVSKLKEALKTGE